MLRAFRAFESEGLEYVLIGATAMGFHGLVRATEDIDLLVRASEQNIERLRQAFRKAYASDPHIDEIQSTDLLGDYPVVRYYPPSGFFRCDDSYRRGCKLRYRRGRGEGSGGNSCARSHTGSALSAKKGHGPAARSK